MARITSLLSILLLSSCQQPPQAKQPNCAARPPEFLSWKDFPENIGGGRWIEAPHKNTIHLDRRDELSWNGAQLGGLVDLSDLAVLDQYVRQVARLEPRPFTTITFDKGASCAKLDRLRAIVRDRLDCAHDRTCFQGRAPAFLN